MWEQIQAHLERLPVKYQHALDRVLSGATTREDAHLDTICSRVRRQMREEEFRVLQERAKARGRVYWLKHGCTTDGRVPKGWKIKSDPQNPHVWFRDRAWAERFVNAFMDYSTDLAHGWHSLFTVKHEIRMFVYGKINAYKIDSPLSGPQSASKLSRRKSKFKHENRNKH